jgi:phage portal protein BeeE
MVPTEQTALTISAVYASINLIAGAIAALPVTSTAARRTASSTRCRTTTSGGR